MKKINIGLMLILSLGALSAHADVTNAEKLAKKYEGIAKAINPKYAGESPSDGKVFFNNLIKVNGKDVACASCHTDNPANTGKHMVTGKPIRPLAPSVNAKRFTDIDKVEENFSKHCNDIIARECTAEEKANFIAYLITVKK